MKHTKVKIIMALAITITIFACIYINLNKSQKIPILLYHHLLYENDYQGDNAFIISVEDFEAQMKYLYDSGYKTITLDDLYQFLYNKKALPLKSVMIHFDDGYYSNITYAYPILKKYGFNAVIFLITTDARSDPPDVRDRDMLITEKDIVGTTDVFEYATHTNNLHEKDNGKPRLLMASREEIINDLLLSIDIVDNKNALAYPYGRYNSNAIAAAKEAGIEMAFTVAKGYVTDNTNPFKLNRFTIYRTTSLSRFKKICK